LRGWLNCFGYCETSKPLIELERWMRHKLRCLVWKRWKRGTTRYKRVC
jgi:RNA-directed DNA polymerase